MPADTPVTILVVDDNPASRYATSRILRSAGFTVLEAATGGEALTLAPQGADLVVLDVNLPDIDGFQVCRELRSKDETARIPVIHLSATFVQDVHKVRGLDAGADGYLTHPVEPPVLIATVNAFLRTRHAEDAMRRSEAKFRAIFDEAINGISLVSRELVFLEVNPAMCAILGRTREDVIGKHGSSFFPAGRENDLVKIAHELERNGTWRGTFPVVASNGRLVELDWNISIHSVPGVRLAIVTDITERKAIEADRERLLASERAARAEAERANRLKDDFLATVSHELRTPLSAILLWAKILESGDPTEEDLREGVHSIVHNAESQKQLIDDLLDMSRISSGKLLLKLRDVELGAVVREAVEAVRPVADAKGVGLRFAAADATCVVRADPDRIQQVLWNLFSNAVKFTDRGGEIDVRLCRAGQAARVAVRDTGKGIAPQFLPHVFERFRQADASMTRRHGGLGLGLALVRELVDLHGGVVRADSEGEGRGATFTVDLPLAAAGAAAPARVEGGGGGAGGSSLEGVKVLLVEDEAEMRRALTWFLEKAGAEVLAVGTAAEAMDALRHGAPHVLVSDIGLPDDDGYTLMRRASTLAIARGQAPVPAVALTAYARGEDRARALAAGFQEYAPKPVEPAELVRIVAGLHTRAV
jgi:PAS domain S-box-containing protein